MRADGYNEHSFKVVATKTIRGIPASVYEEGNFYVSPQDTTFVAFATTVSTISAIVGLSSGTLMAIGVFVITSAGTYIAAKNQHFTNYNLRWIGGKYVSLYGQGNYYQATASAHWNGSAGERGITTNYPSFNADSHYNNNSMLMDLAASKY